MHHCPSCGSTLDADGICTACGALARGFFRGLDLGAPHIATAVTRGLDFYRLLGIAPSTDIRAAAKRFCQLRRLFPDDPSGLQPAARRRLELLEVAGRTLTDPRLRGLYDELRAQQPAAVTSQVLRCTACAAPLAPDESHCAFCGTPRPAEAALPSAPPSDMPPAAEPVDYYALIGLNAMHLNHAPFSATPQPRPAQWSWTDSHHAEPLQLPRAEAPSAVDIEEAVLGREREVLLMKHIAPDERERRLHELELARRILGNARQREQYDQLLRDFRRGQLGNGRLDALQQLQQAARADLAEARGEHLPDREALALVQQGLGYLDAHMPQEAVAMLRQAIRALPQHTAAHAAYVQALLAAEEPLDMGAHTVRQILKSLETLAEHGAPLENGAALEALCQGLLARDRGDLAAAGQALQRAAHLDKHLAPAWRGLAALALARGDTEGVLAACRRALACQPRNERSLLMLTGAYLRADHYPQAREAAAQLAALRGKGWTAEAVLDELLPAYI